MGQGRSGTTCEGLFTRFISARSCNGSNGDVESVVGPASMSTVSHVNSFLLCYWSKIEFKCYRKCGCFPETKGKSNVIHEVTLRNIEAQSNTSTYKKLNRYS